MKTTQSIIVSLAMIFFTASCTSIKQEQSGSPQAAKEAVTEAVKEVIAATQSWAAKAPDPTAPMWEISIQWLEEFNDPVMLKLIAEGTANNINLQAAAANMDKAWLLAEQAGGALKPSLNLSSAGSVSGTAENTPRKNYNVALQMSWELDLWGRIRAGTQSAEASARAAEADYVFAQHSLSANIAKTYLKIIETKAQAGIVRNSVSVLKEILRIVNVKYQNGLASSQDLALSRADLASAKEKLIAIEGSQRDATRGLEVLLGRYPSAQSELPDRLPDLPPQPPPGMPSGMLERRPDIIAAERRVAAAFNAIDQAKAARLPRISLTGAAGGSSGSLSNLLNPANIAWQLAANILAPIYDGGSGKIQVGIANTEQQQALFTYTQAALTAFSEVESNLDQGNVLAQRESALIEVQKENNEAYRIAELRYREGETDLLDTLTIQQRTIAADSNLLLIQRLQLEQRINLYLSLGGGW